MADYREAWGASDAPSLLDPDFNYKLSELPGAGAAAKTPWAGSYWPTYRDGINHRWAGATTKSAAKKYELAFGKTDVEDAVSAHSGVDSLSSSSCTSDAQCDPDNGSVCARRVGVTSGHCSPTWFGICHAWAPAAILEVEPKHAVTHGGVEFKVQDLKALMTLAYTAGLQVRFMSLRCNYDSADGPVADKPACKDTNAGSFHVVVANLLGLQSRSFVEDRTYDDQVWNQPVRSYKVTKNIVLSGTTANQLLGGGTLLSTTNDAGTVAAGVWAHEQAIAVKPGQALRVRVTGTGDADLYVRWNSKPTSTSYTCRPYLNGTKEGCDVIAPANTTHGYISVKGYAASSQYAIVTTLRDIAPSKYSHNDAAVGLRQIRMELSYIAESPSKLDGNLAAEIDTYTRKDYYDYVLELDAAGKIIGGEWIGNSRYNHPDFLWLPMKKYGATVAGKVNYSDIKMLFALAAE